MSEDLISTVITSKDGTEFTFMHYGEVPEGVIEEVKRMTDEEIEIILIGANFKLSRVN